MMRTLVIVADVVLSLFTAFLLVTDGLPNDVAYFALSILLVALPAASAALIQRRMQRPLLNLFMLLCNSGLLVWIARVIAVEYSTHPKEAGLLEYAVLAVAVPLLNCLILAGDMRRTSIRHPSSA